MSKQDEMTTGEYWEVWKEAVKEVNELKYQCKQAKIRKAKAARLFAAKLVSVALDRDMAWCMSPGGMRVSWRGQVWWFDEDEMKMRCCRLYETNKEE